MKELGRQDLVEILYGCAILGTGGGGSLVDGIAMIDEALSQDKKFVLADFDELDPEALVGTPYGCGAISPLTEEERKKYERLPRAKENYFTLATKQAEEFMRKPMAAVISTELGGHNTATAFYVGAMTGKYIVDGDPAGRSVPALQHSTYYLHDVPMCPISVMNQFGEGAIFTSIVDDCRAEDLVRALAVVSQNNIAVVDHINTVANLKDTVIRGAITDAWKIGRAFLDAKASGGALADAVIEAGAGKKMFAGTVTKSEFETRDGYTFGDTFIEGTGECAGHTLRIWYQNENIMSWLDGEIFVTVPDLVCVIDEDNREPQLNPYARVGEKVSVVALPAPAEWTTPRGLEVFGPKFFGYDIEYKPYC